MLNISHRTLQRYCKRHSLKRRPATKKQVLIQRHRVGRLRWAKARRFWTLKKWSTVIFSDECSIAVGKNRRVYVWKVGDEGSYRPDLYGDIKKPLFKTTILGCISWYGVGTLQCMDGTVNSARYRDILDNNLWPVIAKHFGNKEFLFQEDGASIHTSHLMGEYRASTNLPTIQWPAKSPDLNTIENLWSVLKYQLHRRLDEIRSKDDLTSFVREIWENVPLKYSRPLYRSLPNRLSRAIKLKGHLTKY